ncbi:right-handed parallel beta-helix repeat-containing protein [candidate division KSB1 bacterium]|nr:right-handed parallel beta-helix repeat-containing protein [candidate division KSB1 bacterium]
MYDELLDWSVYTGITHGGWYAYQELGANWVTYVLGHSFINDISYYYSERPSFIPASSYTWPPNGPQTNLDWNMTTYPTGWRIPAEDSWEQSVKTYIPDLIIWPPQPPETIEGILTEDQIWRDDILISGDVTVPSGVTVTILANTEVKFQDYYKITVEEGGHISAIGTEYHPIVFKPTTGNSNNKWNQIKLYHTGDNVFKHCTFEYAYYPIYMLSCDDSYGGPNIFENCVFKNNYKYGAYVRGSVAEFTACEIKDNVSYGLYLYTSEVNLTGNRIKNNSRGIVSRSSSDLDLFGNVIENNTQYGLMTYYYDNTKLGSFSTGPYYYGRNTVWNNNSAEVYAYRSNPDVQLIANYIEGEGWGTGDWEVKNYSSNTNDVYCAYGWWGDDELESSGLVTNANQSYLPCGFIIGQTLLEEPAAKQTVQAVSAGDLEIDPYLPLDEKIALAKQIIAEKSNNKEAIDALDLIYSILRSDFRENQLDERNDFVGYLVSLEAQYSNKALGIRALQYLILWRILSGQDDEVIALSDKALKKVSKEDGNMLIGDLAYTYLTRCA